MDSTTHEKCSRNIEEVAMTFHLAFHRLDVLLSLFYIGLKLRSLNLGLLILIDLLVLWINLLHFYIILQYQVMILICHRNLLKPRNSEWRG